MKVVRFFLILLLLSPAIDSLIAEENWDAWRGPHRDGSITGLEWQDNLKSLTPKWQFTAGKTYSSPIITSDRVFDFCSIDENAVGVRALARQDGKVIWETSWQSSGEVPFFARRNGAWVRSTPAWDGETLYAGDMQEVLVALDGESGEERWRIDFPATYNTPRPDFGFSSSPLIDGEFLYIQAVNSILKLEKKSGKVIWRALDKEANMADMSSRGAFSSPVITEIAGKRQLLVLTRSSMNGIDPQDGSVLWSQALPSFRGCHILTPIVYKNSIFTSPLRERSYLLEIQQENEQFSVNQRWTNKASGYMSSPIIVGDYVYLHLGNKRLECIDLRTGETRWRTSETYGDYVSMIWQDDKMLMLSHDGRLSLLRLNPEKFELLDTFQATQSETWAYLGISNQQLYVRSLDGLTVFDWQ